MARITLVVLVLALTMAPAVSAEPPSQRASPFADWLVVIWSYLDWMIPGSQNAGPYVVLSGSGAYIVPDGVQAAPRRHGAYIVPDGGPLVVPSGIRRRNP